jgi:hypothetical protein
VLRCSLLTVPDLYLDRCWVVKVYAPCRAHCVLTGNCLWIPGFLMHKLVRSLGPIHEVRAVFKRKTVILVVCGGQWSQQKGAQDRDHSGCYPEKRDKRIKTSSGNNWLQDLLKCFHLGMKLSYLFVCIIVICVSPHYWKLSDRISKFRSEQSTYWSPHS